MIQIYEVPSEKLSALHEAAVFLIYWKDVRGDVRIGTRMEKNGRTHVAYIKEVSLYQRLEMALSAGVSVLDSLLALPLAGTRNAPSHS